MATQRIVVLGAGYGGILAAVRAARKTRGRASVLLIDASDRLVERIRLHQRAAGQVVTSHALAEITAGSGVTLRQGRISAIRPSERVVVVDDELVPYDHLVIALGSATDRKAVPGLEHVHTLDGRSAGLLGEALPGLAAKGAHVLVCGGGLTGIEAASELAEVRPALKVTLVTAGGLGDELSRAAARHLRRFFDAHGVTVIEHAPVVAVEPEQALLRGRTIAFDACVWAGGFAASPLGRAAGLAVNERGQVVVDAMLRSVSHPDIYAVGDAAAPPPTGSTLMMSCKTAMPMGAQAADNLAARVHGHAEAPFGFGDTGCCISLGRSDGIIQLATRTGVPRKRIITGRLGAWLKERVCRYPVFSLRLEARGLLHYRWLPPVRAALQAREVNRLAS